VNINLGIAVILVYLLTITVSDIGAEKRSFHSFYDNSIHARTTQI